MEKKNIHNIDTAGFTYSARVLNIAGARIRIGVENNLRFYWQFHVQMVVVWHSSDAHMMLRQKNPISKYKHYNDLYFIKK